MDPTCFILFLKLLGYREAQENPQDIRLSADGFRPIPRPPSQEM